MKYIVNSREMKQCDSYTTENFCIPQAVLMERAALALVREMKRRKIAAGRILIVCGSGNNGGDGYAAARLLMLAGAAVDVVDAAPGAKVTEGNLLQRKIWRAYGQEIHTSVPEGRTYTAVVDAVFGVGLSRGVGGACAALLEQMNAMEGAKIAVDVPSGVLSDNGAVPGSAFRADLTVTFAYAKLGCLLWPGNTFAGEVVTADIGMDDRSFPGARPAVAALERRDLAQLAERAGHSNKGTFGKLLVAAGSAGMAGAACLCAKAAYISGCGLVRVFTPEENRVILQSCLPEAVLLTYTPGEPWEEALSRGLGWADAVVLGPGIGTDETAVRLVEYVLAHAEVPVLLDADALNIIAGDKTLLEGAHTQLIITPHPGEMSRLTGQSVAHIQEHLIETAEQFARQYHVTCVLKDEHTVTAGAGGEIWLNLSGCAGLATAGSGDVLSGVIGGLLAQSMAPEPAAPLGVYLHGAAGEAAAEKAGKRGMLASDIHGGLKKVLRALEQETE